MKALGSSISNQEIKDFPSVKGYMKITEALGKLTPEIEKELISNNNISALLGYYYPKLIAKAKRISDARNLSFEDMVQSGIENILKKFPTFDKENDNFEKWFSVQSFSEVTKVKSGDDSEFTNLQIGLPKKVATILDKEGVPMGNYSKTDENLFSDPVAMLHRKETQQVLLEILSTLPQREADILKMRYGIDDNDEMTFAEIAHELKLSTARIRQIESKAERLLWRSLYTPEMRLFLEGDISNTGISVEKGYYIGESPEEIYLEMESFIDRIVRNEPPPFYIDAGYRTKIMDYRKGDSKYAQWFKGELAHRGLNLDEYIIGQIQISDSKNLKIFLGTFGYLYSDPRVIQKISKMMDTGEVNALGFSILKNRIGDVYVQQPEFVAVAEKHLLGYIQDRSKIGMNYFIQYPDEIFACVELFPSLMDNSQVYSSFADRFRKNPSSFDDINPEIQRKYIGNNEIFEGYNRYLQDCGTSIFDRMEMYIEIIGETPPEEINDFLREFLQTHHDTYQAELNDIYN